MGMCVSEWVRGWGSGGWASGRVDLVSGWVGVSVAGLGGWWWEWGGCGLSVTILGGYVQDVTWCCE